MKRSSHSSGAAKIICVGAAIVLVSAGALFSADIASLYERLFSGGRATTAGLGQSSGDCDGKETFMQSPFSTQDEKCRDRKAASDGVPKTLDSDQILSLKGRGKDVLAAALADRDRAGALAKIVKDTQNCLTDPHFLSEKECIDIVSAEGPALNQMSLLAKGGDYQAQFELAQTILRASSESNFVNTTMLQTINKDIPVNNGMDWYNYAVQLISEAAAAGYAPAIRQIADKDGGKGIAVE